MIFLGSMTQNIITKSTTVLLYFMLVRVHLEFCAQFWVPHFKKIVDKAEWVQRKETNMVEGLENEC